MKNKISICILVILGIIISIFLLELLDKKFAEENSTQGSEIELASTQAKEVTKTIMPYEYVIKNDSGMVVVYRNYGTDKFFDTGVYYNELPKDVREKIDNGFGFETESELYDFLESYSS